MEIKVTIRSKQLSKEELRHLIQSIRDCEQKSFPTKEIYIHVDAPGLTFAQVQDILRSIRPPFRELSFEWLRREPPFLCFRG